MSPTNQILRIILTVHGLLNVAQGIYSISYPASWAAQAGGFFTGTHDGVVQSIGEFPLSTYRNVWVSDLIPGLGSLGVGIYGAAGALSGDRRFFAITAAMRVVFGLVLLAQWGWQSHAAVVGYECGVAALAAVAALV